ncbi:hypothetical protein D2E76_16090 [Mycobacteroides abscessus]|uniref:Uncharacterized protein n=1 Tax=Mycobacteroides abscessus TaxID=36809 RepID=A0ABD7HMN6_9MYCO|nr:hypothetical protein [Mycobacteroides abscessus]RIT36776.1 hypothetical protein D2E76_16090 [Mycobacteroides abscessus]
MGLFNTIRQLNRKTQKRLYVLIWLCGPAALILAFIVNERVNALPPPNPVDVPKETALVSKASRFGHDFLILWLAGSASPKNQTLQARIDGISCVPGGIALPSVPFSVTQVYDLGPETVSQAPDGDRNWIFEYDATGTAPGELAAVKRRYSVQFAQHGVSYCAVRSPLPVNPTETPFRLAPGYPDTIDPDSALGKAVRDFADAYLKKGDNASLGRTVSGDFEPKPPTPLQASPYESTVIKAIYGSDVPPADPKPGTTVQVLASLEAHIDDTAFNTVNLPIEMLYTDQSQWVANKLLTDALYGTSTEAPADNKSTTTATTTPGR